MEAKPPGVIDAPPVLLRRYTGQDLPALVEAVSVSVDHLRPWLPWASADPLEPALAEFLARAVEEFERGSNFYYALWDEERCQIVGGTGLHLRLGPGCIEIGYWVRHGWLRRGIATAAAGALTAVALRMEGIDEVHIRCDEANAASAAVPRRLGFELRATVDREVTAPGESGRLMDWVRTR